MTDWSKYEYEDILIIRFGPLLVLYGLGVMSWGEYLQLSNEMYGRRISDGLD